MRSSFRLRKVEGQASLRLILSRNVGRNKVVMVVQKGIAPPHHGAMSTFLPPRIKSVRRSRVLLRKERTLGFTAKNVHAPQTSVIFPKFASSSTIDTFAPPQMDHSEDASP